ncbi:hypothetical protein DLAC_10980 [Tieghemostelium lacteum]|uniref:Large ribosomal subunit protein uL4m n=1 Tax=Tieghemostelium lacteum TaxID=361077 RepID=A0A151Z2Y9_TIELA|nr:hypothetical protein DLAC_10980 [Tieghemostelium lacteum]|eukprot:KYQ88287.1 hypothetical protein DLAC_10980 [Tieghemostelium lacteum]
MMLNLCKTFQTSISLTSKVNLGNQIYKGLLYRGYSTQTLTNTNNTNNQKEEITGTVEVPLIKFSNKEVTGSIQLQKNVFAVPLRVDILHRIVRWQRAKARQGTHDTLNMGKMDKTNKKPFRQKGTGNARRGTNHAVHFKGGAVAHGPHPRDHSFDLQKKVRKLGLKIALSTKLQQNKLVLIESFDLESHKTKDLLSKIPEEWGRSLLVDRFISRELGLSSLNSPRVDTIAERGLNVYSILEHDTVVLTKESAEILQKRL